jgi:ribulose kinase
VIKPGTKRIIEDEVVTIPGIMAKFTDGKYNTNDQIIIKAIENSSAFGIEIFAVSTATSPDIIIAPPKVNKKQLEMMNRPELENTAGLYDLQIEKSDTNEEIRKAIEEEIKIRK